MDIRIYQINSERDKNNVKFMSSDRLQRLQGTQKVDSSIYDKVYAGRVNANSLEDVYRIFNIEHPADFRGHSLSVSDVVEIISEGSSLFYFCDSIGFLNISFDPQKTKDLFEEIEEAQIIHRDPKIAAAMQCLVDNGVDPHEAETVLQALGYILLDRELFPEQGVTPTFPSQGPNSEWTDLVIENPKTAQLLQRHIDELEDQEVPHAEIVHILLDIFSREELEGLGFGEFIADCLLTPEELEALSPAAKAENAPDLTTPLTREEAEQYLKKNGYPHPGETDCEWLLYAGDRQAAATEAVRNGYDLPDVDRWFHLMDILSTTDLSFRAAMMIDYFVWTADSDVLEINKAEDIFEITGESLKEALLSLNESCQNGSAPENEWQVTADDVSRLISVLAIEPQLASDAPELLPPEAKVYICSQGGHKEFLFDGPFETCRDFCNDQNWQWKDEHDFVWDLELEDLREQQKGSSLEDKIRSADARLNRQMETPANNKNFDMGR